MSLIKIIGAIRSNKNNNRNGRVIPAPGNTLLNRIANSTKSGEVFNFSTGVNEFDLVPPSKSHNGKWQMVYDARLSTFAGITYREANTFEGLATATPINIIENCRYPFVIYSNGNYYVGGRDFGGQTKIYKSSLLTNFIPGSNASKLLNESNLGIDFSVIQKPDGSFLGSGKDAVEAYPYTVTSPNMDTVFTGLLKTFDKQGFCSNSVTDGAVFYDTNNDLWILFGATNTNPPTQQTIGIAKINPTTRLIIGNPIEIIVPTQTWEGQLIFNPVYVKEGSIERIYYSANKGDEATPLNGGIGYLQLPSVNVYDTAFVNRIVNGTKSGELFNFPFGVNEYDLITPAESPDGLYHMFNDPRDPNATVHRQAATFAGLATATVTLIKTNLRYPTAIYYNGKYHVWGRNFANTGKVEHYSSTTIAGFTGAVADDMFESGIDCHIRPIPNSTNFIRGQKTNVNAQIFTDIATSINGAWKNRLGNDSPLDLCLPTKQSFFSLEEADPAPFYKDGKLYILFSSWNGTVQSIGIAELNQNTGVVIGTATQIIVPNQTWEGTKIFNAVYVKEGTIERIYYAANKGTESAPQNGGIGYLEF